MKSTPYLAFGCLIAFALILLGCDAKPPAAKPDTSKIQEFTNNLETANVDYSVSYYWTSDLIGQAIREANSPSAQRLNDSMQSFNGTSYDGAKDFLQNYAHFDSSITNAENAIACIEKIDSNFQYLYTTYKTLPPSFKDDFYSMKDLMGKNLTFIQTLKQGEVDKDSLQAWLDGNTKIEDSYKSIQLEIQRLSK
jgi:hypothetical protein